MMFSNTYSISFLVVGGGGGGFFEFQHQVGAGHTHAPLYCTSVLYLYEDIILY